MSNQAVIFDSCGREIPALELKDDHPRKDGCSGLGTPVIEIHKDTGLCRLLYRCYRCEAQWPVVLEPLDGDLDHWTMAWCRF